MGIEWFRDLSITILGFMTSAAIIFIAILAYRMYRTLKSTVLLVKATSKITYDMVTLLQEAIKPIFPFVAVIQGLCGGFEGISKMFNKESNKGGNNNE
jgi:hypothetical protein